MVESISMMCEDDLVTLLPQWGGKATCDFVKMTLTNACPIDNLLWIFHNIFGHRSDIFNEMKEIRQCIKCACKCAQMVEWQVGLVVGCLPVLGIAKEVECVCPRETTIVTNCPSTK